MTKIPAKSILSKINPINALILVILLLTAVLYIPVFKNMLTNWDDELYILNNPFLQSLSLKNIRNIFTSFFAGNYHPLTLLSMAIDYKLGGTQPWPYHLTNLILHLGNILLVYLFIKSLLQLSPSLCPKNDLVPALTALLFGIHTLQVESVAWIAEQKNVLYSIFFLASLIMYIKYLQSPIKKYYILSIILFILSLLSKGMAIPLSLCIMLIDFFSGRNLLSKKVIWEKIPFLTLSLLFGIIAILAQQSGDAILSGKDFSWIERITIASYGFIQYLIKLAIPVNLSAYYPYPVEHGKILPIYFYACIGLVSVIFFTIWRYFRQNKIVLFGTLFFVINISIVIQLLPVGNAIMADRYVYVPSIGFFFILVYYGNAFWQKYKAYRTVFMIVMCAYCVFLLTQTHLRIGIWKDSLTLWNDAIDKYPDNNDRGYQNRGNLYFDMGNYSDAMQEYTRLNQIDPKNDAAYIGFGRIKMISRDLDGALHDFNTALSLNKTYEGYINRSVIKIDTHDFSDALADADSAARINPYRAPAFINIGYIYYLQGNYTRALEKYSQAILIDPQNSKFYLGRARIKQALNDVQGAMDDFTASLSIRQTFDGYLYRAILEITTHNFENACSDLDAALQLQPDASAFYYRGISHLNLSHKEQGCADLNQSALMGYQLATDELNKNCK